MRRLRATPFDVDLHGNPSIAPTAPVQGFNGVTRVGSPHTLMR